MRDDIAHIVQKILEHLGFEVTRVEEGNQKTPDLYAERDGEIHIIEVKAKLDDARREGEMERAFDKGVLFEEVLPLGPRNRIAGIVRHGVRQIGAHAENDPLRLLWFMVIGSRAEVYAKQIRATLLGSTRVYDLQDLSWQRECFFFHHSEFFRWQENLDGAVVGDMWSGKLLLNPFSPRLERLRRSPLAVTFGTGVVDPVALENQGDACVVDGDVDRSDEAAVQAYVQQKYGRPMLQSIEMGYHGVWAGFPVDDHEGDGT